MLSRGLTSLSRGPVRQPARGMATEAALRQQIDSVKNIKKITSAMKMVAACKLKAAQDRLQLARQFAQPLNEAWIEPKNENPKTACLIGVSSDRGLCGAINSSIARAVRDRIAKAEKDPTNAPESFKIMMIGEKAKQALERQFANQFVVTVADISKFKACTFKQCGELTDYWLGIEADKSTVLYQKFKSMIAYETTAVDFWSYDAVEEQLEDDFADYEIEGDQDTLRNYSEFRNCVSLYHFFAENETSTLSARMAAMDGSSKNASEMVDDLSLLLNRSRQARITTELSEIISGAAALDG